MIHNAHLQDSLISDVNGVGGLEECTFVNIALHWSYNIVNIDWTIMQKPMESAFKN